MKINLDKTQKGEGEITFFFITLTFSFFIVLFLLIVIMSENNFVFERIMRTLAERTSKRASVLCLKNDTELNSIFEVIKADTKEDVELLYKHFLSKKFREEVISNLTLVKLVKTKDIMGSDILTEISLVPDDKSYEEVVNGYKIYLIKNNYEKKWYINLVFLKYRPRSFGYVFVRQTDE